MNYSIAAVERDTGLSKDVLRVWERRYGFPAPARDAHGERVYPADQVERLRLIKRLMDQGHRPGKLISAAPESLTALPPRRPPRKPSKNESPAADDLEEMLEMIRQHDAAAFQQALQQSLARQGLLSFVQDTVAPLTSRVGQAWEQGNFEVFEEHLFTELTKRQLRQIISSLPVRRGGPRILLTTVPDEKHVLGLLMAEALLALDGADCIPLGTQMPLLDIARAAGAYQADVVALSFSSAFPSRQIPLLLQQLKPILPPGTQLWAGGAGVANMPATAGLEYLPSFEDARQALTRCHQAIKSRSVSSP